MIKSVKIYNRFHMDSLLLTKGSGFPYKHWDLISIHSESKDIYLTNSALETLERFGMKSGISLRFSDITDKQYEHIKLTGPKLYPTLRLFSKDNAKEIIRFIKHLQRNIMDTNLVIHCDAGISRSGAVGTFASEYCNLNYDLFLKENPYIYSNPYILSVLRELSDYKGVQHDGIDHTTGDLLDISRLKNKIKSEREK